MPKNQIPITMRPLSHVLPLTVKFNLADYERVRAEASSHGLTVSSYLRQKALTGEVRPPIVINPICQEQWRDLSRVSSNLNRLLFLLNSGTHGPELSGLQSTIEEAKTELKAVRSYLAGATAA
jgi:hypothetical protein